MSVTEHTLHFDNPREAQDITGARFKLLPRVERELGIEIHQRDLWLKLSGEEDAVLKAARFFEGLRLVRDHGISMGEHGLNYALEAFKKGQFDVFQRLSSIRIDVGRSSKAVYPRTFGQQVYLEDMSKKPITFGIGPAGTGKTYLAMACAVSALLKEEVTRIILTRPAIEAGENLGFLPGDLREKIDPYLRPLHDALYDMLTPDEIERYREKGVIEVAPLAYMRGRTLNNAFIVLDEAQNTTQEQMFMFLTRLGFNSKCVVTGDITQVDLPRSKQSGLLEARNLLQGIDDIAFVELAEEDVVRHPIVQKVIRAYRERPSKSKGGNA